MTEPESVEVARAGAWRPFRNRTFAVLWGASLLSNIGTWTHDVGAGWLMTTLSASPVDVALVQAASTVPMFLFALPAGALADIFDRRRILLASTLALAAIAAVLGLAVAANEITVWRLLVFTFALGIGAALSAPAWQSLVPRLVPPADVPAAIALNSVGVNVSRAIGPALGGALIVNAGIAWPFFANAASFLAVIGALVWWRPPRRPPPLLPAERIAGAMRVAIRHTRASAPLRSTLWRALSFFAFSSAYWALLPLVARQQLDGGAELYGVLVSCVGVGAVVGALILPALRRRVSASRVVGVGSLGTAAALVAFALVHDRYVAAAASFVAGMSWVAALATLNVSAQMSLPDWVRARGLAIYNTVFFGAMAFGSVLWGHTATWLDIPSTLLIAAAGSVASALWGSRIALVGGNELDFSPSSHWPAPIVAEHLEGDRGPVMVTIEYHIDPADAPAFVHAIHALEAVRRRDGAVAWSVFRDVAVPERWVEQFVEESWLDHLRHHERVSHDDRAIQERVAAFHRGAAAPVVTHYVAPDPHGVGPSPNE